MIAIVLIGFVIVGLILLLHLMKIILEIIIEHFGKDEKEE